jgi:CPA2 family monovalent cation:H+ antiporter-2
MIAKEMKGHIVVIGYSHLGQRLVSYFIEKKIPYCLIEKDKERIDELLRQGEAVVVDDAKENDALHDANLMNAKMVIIASNNLETALIVTKRARQLNKDCQIITRCFQDEFAEILESLGADEVISSSKNAFEDIAKKIKD